MTLLLKKLTTTVIVFFSINSYAVPVTFTNSTAFSTAIGAYTATTQDFESSTAGNVVTNGGTLGGITFNYNALASLGVSMQIRDDFSANSGNNYLGTDDLDGLFQGGDGFSINFSSANAIGMFFISGDELFDEDIALTVNNTSGTTVSLLSSLPELTLSDGSFVHFLGVVDDMNTFSSAAVSSPGCGSTPGCFFYNVDDITTAATPSSNQVPAPPVIALLLVGLIPMLRNNKVKIFAL